MSFRFLEFPVYKNIKTFIKDVYSLTSTFPKNEEFGLAGQLKRSATSIALNLAEGSDRGSDNEFRRFVELSLGSLNESVATLDICHDNGFINDKIYGIMLEQAENIVKQPGGLRKSLK